MSDMVSCYCSNCDKKTLRKVDECKCTSSTSGDSKNSTPSAEQQTKDRICPECNGDGVVLSCPPFCVDEEGCDSCGGTGKL